jgi:hypothetical protein
VQDPCESPVARDLEERSEEQKEERHARRLLRSDVGRGCSARRALYFFGNVVGVPISVPLSTPEPPRVPGGIPPDGPCGSGFCIVGPGDKVAGVFVVDVTVCAMAMNGVSNRTARPSLAGIDAVMGKGLLRRIAALSERHACPEVTARKGRGV